MRSPKQHQQSFYRQLRSLPRQIAIEAHDFFDKHFEKQGFHDDVVHHWEQRKPVKSKPRRGNPNRGILILTGALRRSLQVHVQGTNIIIQSLMPYARLHNEGLLMKNKKPMTKRPFVGNSRTLNKHISQLIRKTLQQA